MSALRWAAIAGLCVAAMASAQGSTSAQPVDLVAAVPDGIVKTVLQRLPEDELRALTLAAGYEVRQKLRDAQPGDAAVEKELERLVGARLALLVTANTFANNASALSAWNVSDVSDFREAAMAAQVDETALGRRLLTNDGLDRIRELLWASPYVWRPRTPCNEGGATDSDRLSSCVDRKAYRSVVGLAWPDASGALVISCTGQLVSRKFVLTADHCFDQKASQPTVLTHYTGGTAQATLGSGGRVVPGLTRHATQAVFRGTTQALPNGLRGFDLAVIQLQNDVGFDGFPGLAVQLPTPLKMTVAGWGQADVRPVNDVALEVTVVSPLTDMRAVDPSLRAWPATLVAGGGICRGDSGGPIYGGPPEAGAAGLKLIGLVAGGNLDCKTGDQVITDLTRRETVQYMCALAPALPYCAA